MTESPYYEICIEGHVDHRWALWFPEMTIRWHRAIDGTPITTVAGPVVDQTALYGLLNRLRDMGATLRAVQKVTHRAATPTDGRESEETS